LRDDGEDIEGILKEYNEEIDKLNEFIVGAELQMAQIGNARVIIPAIPQSQFQCLKIQ